MQAAVHGQPASAAKWSSLLSGGSDASHREYQIDHSGIRAKTYLN